MTEPTNLPKNAANRRIGYEKAFLLGLHERMVLIRQFEDGIKFLFLEGTMPGTIHQCQGQEATAVGVCAALREGDFITSTFRGHGHALAKGLSMQELLDEHSQPALASLAASRRHATNGEAISPIKPGAPT